MEGGCVVKVRNTRPLTNIDGCGIFGDFSLKDRWIIHWRVSVLVQLFSRLNDFVCEHHRGWIWFVVGVNANSVGHRFHVLIGRLIFHKGVVMEES